YYLYNSPYESLWRNNYCRNHERQDTWDILRKYNEDWRLVIVGDATMCPYEILQPGGSVEHYHKEIGAVWLQRLVETFPKMAWLNPEPKAYWEYRQSIAIIKNLIQVFMYSVTERV